MPPESLDELRIQIDSIDHELLELLRRRMITSEQIGALKAAAGRQVYDPQREKMLLAKLTANDHSPLTSGAIEGIYREIISASRALQRVPAVAFLGPEHTFSHQAALKHFGSRCHFEPQSTIEDVFSAVERGMVDEGIVPIENTIQGVETRTLDAFINSSLIIAAEAWVDVHICVLTHGDLSQIKRVLSHPQPLAQCRQWLHRNLPKAELIPVASTAAAAAAVAAEGDCTQAALSTAEAAVFYQLPIIAENVEDRANNRTRFFILSKNETGPTGKDKTSLLFTTRHRSGALASALVPLSAHQISLTLIQSRPAPARLEGPYIFYVDFEGHQEEPMVKAAIDGLREQCQTLKVLGSYPASG
ncbi:MAG: prephenate dehydratase [Bacteroidota bacterium]